jgi:hypothetical protein
MLQFSNMKQPLGYTYYVAPLKLGILSNKYLYVFFDTECTQYLKKRNGPFEHVPILSCAQQMCCKCEAVEKINVHCEQYRKRVHSFWQEPVCKFIVYLRLSRQFADKVCHFPQLLRTRRTISA